MDFNEKLRILNGAANNMRLSIKAISNIFKDDIDCMSLIFKVNKDLDKMQSYIGKNIEKEIINFEFDKIVNAKKE
jgi:hypothetical protein